MEKIKRHPAAKMQTEIGPVHKEGREDLLQKMKQIITASRQKILKGLHQEWLDTKGTTLECWLNLTLPLCAEPNPNSEP